MNTKTIIGLGLIGVGVLLYIRQNNKPVITADKSNASGDQPLTIDSIGAHPCFCDGKFMGYVKSKSDCRYNCRKQDKFGEQ